MDRQAAYEAALREGRKQARIHGYHAWSNDMGISFAAGWAAGLEEGKRQSQILDPEVAEVVAETYAAWTDQNRTGRVE